MPKGTTTIDFGAFPGKCDTSAAVTGQAAIVAESLVEAWLRPVATADHSADEHMVEALKVVAGNISAGTGFTIYGHSTWQGFGDRSHFVYGLWTVAWAWA